MPSHEATPAVHLVNPFWNPHGGSELRALELAKALSTSCRVQLWSPERPKSVFASLANIRQIRTSRLCFPYRGTLVIVGAYFAPGHWLKLARPHRTILIYNTPDPDQLEARLRELHDAHHRSVEIVYSSEDLRAATGLPGTVETSLIDLDRFAPARRQTPAFTIGRFSRDVAVKHHIGDPDFYRRFLKTGARVRIMGPSPDVRARLEGVGGVDLLQMGETPPEDFLKSIDCLFYRTSDSWFETWGRVVVEAMAAGLPVVCGRRGGYQSIIRHGENGFLFDREEEAELILERLRWDSDLRRRIGQQARSTAERLLVKAKSDIIDFYTASPEPTAPRQDAWIRQNALALH